MPKVFYGVVDIKHIAIEDRPMKINITRKISLCIIALAGFTLGGCTMSMSANQAPEAVVNPPIYQKEVLISTGYANISAQKSKSPAQQRLMAIRVSEPNRAGLWPKHQCD